MAQTHTRRQNAIKPHTSAACVLDKTKDLSDKLVVFFKLQATLMPHHVCMNFPTTSNKQNNDNSNLMAKYHTKSSCHKKLYILRFDVGTLLLLLRFL